MCSTLECHKLQLKYTLMIHAININGRAKHKISTHPTQGCASWGIQIPDSQEIHLWEWIFFIPHLIKARAHPHRHTHTHTHSDSPGALHCKSATKESYQILYGLEISNFQQIIPNFIQIQEICGQQKLHKLPHFCRIFVCS